MNQNPEQLRRDKIDAMLEASGWIVQAKKDLNLAAGLGVAVREYQTGVGPADYVLFVDGNLLESLKLSVKKKRCTLPHTKIRLKAMQLPN